MQVFAYLPSHALLSLFCFMQCYCEVLQAQMRWGALGFCFVIILCFIIIIIILYMTLSTYQTHIQSLDQKTTCQENATFVVFFYTICTLCNGCMCFWHGQPACQTLMIAYSLFSHESNKQKSSKRNMVPCT